MNVGKSITPWVIVGSLGYGLGWWFKGGINPQDASSVLKASAAIFSAALFSLGFIFRLLETPAPQALDDARQDRWTKVFSHRWSILWIRWFVLLVAPFACTLSFLALDGKLTIIPDQTAIRLGAASVAVGIVAILVSVIELFLIRKRIREISVTLRDAKKRQQTLNKLEGPPPGSPAP